MNFSYQRSEVVGEVVVIILERGGKSRRPNER